ncbi:hypothetical protein Pmar_PMAR016431, partial [Perkinsus marinus ATCC 50983]
AVIPLGLLQISRIPPKGPWSCPIQISVIYVLDHRFIDFSRTANVALSFLDAAVVALSVYRLVSDKAVYGDKLSLHSVFRE